MAAMDDAFAEDPLDTPGLVLARLRWTVNRMSADFTLTKEQVEGLTKQQTVDHADLVNLGKDVSTLTTKLDRLTWAIVLLALTVAAGALSLAISIASGG